MVECTFGGSPRIYAGEGALQRSGKKLAMIARFSAGNWETRAKAHFEVERFSARLKSRFPLLKQGGSHEERSPEFFSSL